MTQLTLICSKSTTETLGKRAKYIQSLQQKHQNDACHSGVFVINFEHISRLFLVFLLFILSKLMLAGKRLPS